MKKTLAFIFIVAAILRLGLVWLAPGWYDENFTLLVTRLPFAQMMQAVIGDVHPPLWYLILWPLGQMHAPVWVLRIPAALCSLASVWVFWRILQALDLSPNVRLAALALMAVMPVQIYYAMEARMYALLELLVLLAFLALLQRRGWLFALAGVLMLYTQYYGAFYLAALFVAALVIHKGDYKILFGPSILFISSFLPWALIVMLPQMGTLSGAYWMQLTGPGMALRVLFQALFFPPQNAVVQIPLMLGGFGWLFGSLVYAFRRDGSETRPYSPLIMAFLPFLLAIAFSLVWQPVLHYRPLIAITPFLYILLAAPAEKLHTTSLRPHFLAEIFLLPILYIPFASMYLNLRYNKLPYTTLETTYIAAHWQAGDIVYAMSDDAWVNAAPVAAVYRSPDCAPSLGALSPKTRTALGMQILPLAQIPHTRAWLLWSDSPLDPPCSLPPAGNPLLSKSDEFTFDGLWLYTNNSSTLLEERR